MDHQREQNADTCNTVARRDYLHKLVGNSRMIQIQAALLKKFNVKKERTIRAPNAPPPTSLKWTHWKYSSSFLLNVSVCSRDKDWEMAASESGGVKGQRNANSGFCLWVSDCSERTPPPHFFFSKSLPRLLWIDANYHAQQCFSTILNDVPFVEKPLKLWGVNWFFKKINIKSHRNNQFS